MACPACCAWVAFGATIIGFGIREAVYLAQGGKRKRCADES